MKQVFKWAFSLLFIFVGCKSQSNFEPKEVEFIDTNFHNLKTYLLFEKNANSKDASYDHFVEISESICPNFYKYNLKKESKRFTRADQSKFISYASYYYDKKKNVKLIFYEWDFNGSNNDFKKEFDSIANFLNSRIGQYDFKNFEADGLNETSRDDIKWEKTKTKAYLFRFKNNFNQICLAIYKD